MSSLSINQINSQSLPLCITNNKLEAEEGDVCLAIPKSSNSKPEKQGNPGKVMFINGIGSSKQYSSFNAELLANHLGEPVERIYNDREGVPYVGGILHSIASKLSRQLGAYLERDAVKNLMSSMWAGYKSGNKVEVHAHSQGSIIVRDTLDIMEDRLLGSGRDVEWQEFKNNLHISTYGAAEHNWDDIAVNEYRLKTDGVPISTSLVDRVIRRTKRIFSSDTNQKVKLFELQGGFLEHSFQGYIARMGAQAVH